MEHEVAEIVKEILQEGLVHTATMIPVLFLVFLAMEFISHQAKGSWIARVTRNPILGPIGAALIGLLPQCGFSIATTTLYLEGLIPTGSLIAAYIATSDEAIPILLGDTSTVKWIVPLLASKLAWGSIVGIAINLALGRRSSLQQDTPSVSSKPTHHHNNKNSCFAQSVGVKEFLPHALTRTVRISAMVFVLSSAFNLAGHLMEGTVSSLLIDGGLLQPLAASLVGLIPSCASSVVLAESFRAGFISFPALFGGLCANAGIGLLVLVKEERNKMQVVSVIVLLLVAALVGGTLATLLV